MFLIGIRKLRKNKGFLFIEIIVSVSILSLGLLLILNSFIRPARAIKLSVDYFRAGLLVEEKMSELYNSGMKCGITKGEFNSFDGRFSWMLDIRIPESGLYREINLKVYWRNKDKEEDLSVLTYI